MDEVSEVGGSREERQGRREGKEKEETWQKERRNGMRAGRNAQETFKEWEEGGSSIQF